MSTREAAAVTHRPPERPETRRRTTGLGPLAALSCHGNRSIQFSAKLSSSGFADGFGEGALPDPIYPGVYWAAPTSVDYPATFGTKLDPARFPQGDSDIPYGSLWKVVGHFDDQSASACSIDGPPTDQSAATFVLTCRTTFVVTNLDPTASS